MKKLPTLAVASVAAGLVACGGSGVGNGSGPTVALGGSSATVSVQNLDGAGRVLVSSSGHALYASNVEAGGKVACTGACESFWMPLTVNGGQPTGSVPGMLGVIQRPDGNNQVTFNGRPLYSFVKDGPGQVTGNDFHDSFGGQQFTWNVVAVGGGGGGSTSTPSSGGGGYGY